MSTGPFVQSGGSAGTPADVSLASEHNQRGTVLSLGLLLVAVNVFTTEAGLQLVGNVTGLPVSGLTPLVQSGTWVPVRDIALQVLMVLLMAGFAGLGEGAGSLALTMVAALWLVWLITHVGLWSSLIGQRAPAALSTSGALAGGALGASPAH